MNSIIFHPATEWVLLLGVVTFPCLMLGLTAYLVNKSRTTKKGSKRDAFIWSIVSAWGFLILILSFSFYAFQPPQSYFAGGLAFVLFIFVQTRLDQIITREGTD